MNDRELLDQAKELVDKVYENMSSVETYNMAKGRVLSGEIGVLMPEDGRAMSLVEFLSEEQHGIIRDSVIACIDSNLERSRNFLRCANAVNEGMKLGAMAEEAAKECEEDPKAAEASDEPENTPVEGENTEKAEEKTKKAEASEKHTPTKEELLEDFKNGLKFCEMAKKYGYKSSSSITAILGKYGLDKQGKLVKDIRTDKAALMEFIEGRIDEVKALYTKGPFTLKELAAEYSTDQKLLHEVLAAKGLLKGKK